MRPIAILAAALVALYMLGRRASRTDAGPAPDDIDWLGEYRSPTNTITLTYPRTEAWRLN